MQQRALLAVLRGLSLRRCAAWTGLARQTVRRWQAWLAGRHEVFAFHLRSRFGELGRAGELAEFWQTCWRSVSLADAMTWLNLVKIGRAHVCTPVTNAHLVCSLLLDNKKIK